MKTLSTIGRMVTIKSVDMAMPLYTMSSCKIPTTSCQELDAIVRKFWWKGNLDSSRFLATKAWDVLCQPKGCGGLGFEDLKRPTDNPIWKGILEARKLICEGACTMLANGEDTNIWWQPWIPWLDYSEFRETMELARAKAPSLCCVADLMFRRIKCSMAKALWFGGPFPLRTESIPGATLSEVICSILPLLEGSSKLSFLIWMASVFETIWLWRNRARYGRIVNILVDEMLNNALNRFVEMSDTHKPSFEQMLLSLTTPARVCFKVILVMNRLRTELWRSYCGY
uniref:Uncharacterized protein n=1 Tax=Cannabis sativa TaxID=3483 RepID=A0A803PL51_CANSA